MVSLYVLVTVDMVQMSPCFQLVVVEMSPFSELVMLQMSPFLS